MMFSFLASAVTISTGSLLRFGSARMALSISRPSMFGMFQSETTKSKLPLRSFSSPSAPSSASSTFSKPRSLSRFLMMRRMVGKSSTTSIFIALFTNLVLQDNQCAGTQASDPMPVCTRGGEDAPADVAKGDGIHRRADVQRLARHAENDACRFVLRHGD